MMTASSAPYGLLLDVDGPIANPETRTITDPTTAADIVTIAEAGVPIAFNTGRGTWFLQHSVLPKLVEAGLDTRTRLGAVCEKGAVTAVMGAAGITDLRVDPSLTVPQELRNVAAALIAQRYADVIVVDPHKESMLSMESVPGLPTATYLPIRDEVDAQLMDWLDERGIGYRHPSREHAGADGSVPLQFDPQIISTDVEPIGVGKALGAERALELLGCITGQPAPHAWYTVGDSRTDYAMAGWLHEHGYDATHVDVRPADGVPDVPYPVRTMGELTNATAGAAFLRELAAALG